MRCIHHPQNKRPGVLTSSASLACEAQGNLCRTADKCGYNCLCGSAYGRSSYLGAHNPYCTVHT